MRNSMYLLPLSLACMLSLLTGTYIEPPTWAPMSIVNLQVQPCAHVHHPDRAGITGVDCEPYLVRDHSPDICNSKLHNEPFVTMSKLKGMKNGLGCF